MTAPALKPLPDSPDNLLSGARFRAYPSWPLGQTLAQWIGSQRVVFNAKTTEDRYFASLRRLELATSAEPVSTPLDRAYSQFKSRELTPWLFDVPSQVLRNGSDRWYDAKQRQLKGLAKAPTIRNRSNFNSVVITSELFRFRDIQNAMGAPERVLELGTVANPVGILPFKAHRPFGIPKTIVIRRTSVDEWYVSFCYASAAPEGFVARTAEELAYELKTLDAEALAACALGVDRNVKTNAVATSDGRFFYINREQQERLKRKEIGRKRLQRRAARKVKGSANRRRAYRRVAKSYRYGANVRQDFSHQTSHSLVTEATGDGAAPLLIAFEDLKIPSMVRRPKAKQDASGKWVSNRRAQKAGLNKAILSSCWGAIASQVQYKAARRNILFLKVPAAYSSQECSRCGHTHPDNRHEQSFACQRCSLVLHADTNAGRVTKKRGIAQVRAQEVKTKAKKSVNFRKRKPSNPGAERPAVPVENL